LASPKACPGLRNVSLYIDSVLSEKVLRFKFPDALSVRIPSGQAQSFATSSPRACYHIQQRKGLRSSGRAAPLGRDEIDASSRRVTCTHASWGRESRRSEISSSGETAGGFDTNKGAVTGFVPVPATFLGFTAAFLGAAEVLGSAFSGFAFFLVAVAGGSFGALVTGWGLGLGVGEVVLILITRPPRPTWLHPSPKSCSAQGSSRLAFGAAGWLVATVWRLWAGARFARAVLASFHFTQPR
jgi:hypothetical protein